MKTLINIDLDALLSDAHNQRELLGHLMSEDDFLESFVQLIATGRSAEGSYPAYLDKFREKLHRAMGDEYHAEAMRRVQEAAKARDEEAKKRWGVEHRLQEAQELLPRVFAEGSEHKLTHGGNSNYCDACRFLRVIRGEP